MTDTTTPRVAIVTGGSRGIGRAVAERLAADGQKVVIAYAGRTDAADETVEAIRAAGGEAVAVQTDIADEHQAAALFARAQQEFGGVDVVVNAAGITVPSTIEEMDLDDLDRIIRTNLRGAFVIAQQAAKHVRDGGSVVLFSTSVVGTQLPRYSAYVATKAAVESITLIFARELRGRDITVNTVAPGPTATEFFFTINTPEQIEERTTQSPLERLGQPGDMASVVAFLTGEQGHWVNGQTIRANGGLV